MPPQTGEWVRIMALIATAIFVGIRFLPARHRQPVGVVLTVCYLAGLLAFAVYLLAG